MLIAIKLKLALACAAGLIGPLLVAPLVMERDGGNPGLRDQQAVVELHPVVPESHRHLSLHP